jgi:hypothetical protein
LTIAFRAETLWATALAIAVLEIHFAEFKGFGIFLNFSSMMRISHSFINRRMGDVGNKSSQVSSERIEETEYQRDKHSH